MAEQSEATWSSAHTLTPRHQHTRTGSAVETRDSGVHQLGFERRVAGIDVSHEPYERTTNSAREVAAASREPCFATGSHIQHLGGTVAT